MDPRQLSIADFDYVLPGSQIALHPLPERDASRLLIYRKGQIDEDSYRNIATHIPSGMLMVFNNTKVIHARLRFNKSSGGRIEIFCLEPAMPGMDYAQVMAASGPTRWKCLVGGAGKWKGGLLTQTKMVGDTEFVFHASIGEKSDGAFLVDFSWTPADSSFAQVLDLFGDVPLPPYIKRSASEADRERYQTVYARHAGSVAAPTAGLHFTERVMRSLEEKGMSLCYVTLHVGAGTFLPVKSDTMVGHIMHSEWIDVERSTVEAISGRLADGIVAVGTTSVRTLESLYWMGVRVLLRPDTTYAGIALRQWDPYEEPFVSSDIDAGQALKALLDWMRLGGYERIVTTTQLIIAPGYRYRLVRALVTNFHQPQSTLLLLVAAALGDDWKSVYAYALDKGFRMLSYGDGSLLFVQR